MSTEQKPTYRPPRIVKLFSFFTSEQPTQQRQHTAELIMIIKNAQRHFQMIRDKTATKPESSRNLQSLDAHMKAIRRYPGNSAELDYSLSRLIRGLGTSSDITRVTFSSVFTAVRLLIVIYFLSIFLIFRIYFRRYWLNFTITSRFPIFWSICTSTCSIIIRFKAVFDFLLITFTISFAVHPRKNETS
jgi:hypothetical protein